MPDPLSPAPGRPVEMHLEAPSAPHSTSRDVPSRFAEVLARPAPDASVDAPRPWLDALREGGRAIAQGEDLLERAVRAGRRGAELDHAELLALQAGVYRYSRALELSSKLVDKTTGAIRQTMQSQH